MISSETSTKAFKFVDGVQNT